MADFNIYFISDAIGDSAEKVVNMIVKQYDDIAYQIKKYHYVIHEEYISEIIEEASREHSVVFFTTVLEHLRQHIILECKGHSLPFVDLLSPIMKALECFTGQKPDYRPGVNYELNEQYYRKIEAVEFAVKYDDGKDPQGIYLADVVILGVSRTSKTPLSMYLAHQNLKVVNIPIVPEIEIPEEVYLAPKHKVFGLITHPAKLEEIRTERLKTMGLSAKSNYANIERILEELDYAKRIMNKIGCPMIDVSNKAVEETASIIMDLMKANR